MYLIERIDSVLCDAINSNNTHLVYSKNHNITMHLMRSYIHLYVRFIEIYQHSFHRA